MSERADRRKDLPAGTVTFLFADIEGSTRLLNALGARFRPVRARTREIVRQVAARHEGAEVDWAGDGVFLAFRRARDAVGAAAELQRALAAEPWPPDEAIRLRIGIHTGEPELDGDGYVGMDVVVAARICSAAHGGQVVVSRSTRDLVGDAPLADASLRPLGDHRLKDVPDPRPLFQLVGDGLTETFPPLSTFGGATLPALHHRLVGREAQVADVERLIARQDVRLVTITGPGGAGKSRLALEVCAELAGHRPVHLVPLASTADSSLVPAAVARVLGVRESTERPLVEDIAGALAGRRTLLYLDNLEHLETAADHVRELLDAVPDLDVLATSRSPLGLSRERVVPLAPLPLDDAVELFLELAEARGAMVGEETVPSIRDICRRLDCLPLAIELVAARLRFLSPAQLVDELERGLALRVEGSRDLPARQRTLRATIDWSYGLLTPTQQELHCVLAVFAGGCALEDARVVAGHPEGFLRDVEALVVGSLVRGDTTGSSVRLSMLETVREDALLRLEATGRLDGVRHRHADWVLALAQEVRRGLEGHDHASWADRVERELDNVRAALEFLFSSGRVEDALEATAALERFWRARGHVTEARRWLALGLARGDAVSRETRAAALWTAAQQAAAQSDWDAAAPMLAEARELYRAAGRSREEVFALANASFVALRRGELAQAERLAEEAVSVAGDLDDPRAASAAVMVLADVHSARGAHDDALERYEQALGLRARLDDPFLVCDAVYNLALAAYRAGEHARARAGFDDALTRARTLDEAPYVAACQLMLAVVDLGDDDAGARARAQESLDLYTELEDDRSRARCLVVLAGSHAESGDAEAAARLLGAAAVARGPDELDEFELPVVGRCLPRIEEVLGRTRADELIAEGRRGQGVLARVATSGPAS